MKKIRILVDCDGPLSDFEGSALDLVERETGKRYDRDQLTSWDTFGCLGLTNFYALMRADVETNGFCLRMKEVPGSAPALKFMNEIGEVFVVTASFDAYNWDLDRRMWLNTKFGIDKEHIIQTSAKHVVDGDLFIDDRPENIVSWIEAHPKGYALLWDLPHNHGFNLNSIDKYCQNRVERALSWPHVIYMIERLKSRT